MNTVTVILLTICIHKKFGFISFNSHYIIKTCNNIIVFIYDIIVNAIIITLLFTIIYIIYVMYYK